MKTNNRYIIVIVAILANFLLIGCRNNTNEIIPSIESEPIIVTTEVPALTDTPAPTDTPTPEPTATVEVATIKSINITVYNLSNVDIGMFSVIDPVTGHQINVSALAVNESLSLESDWPMEVKEFQWALYNNRGELCISASTDITEANTEAHITFTGDGNITNVETAFK